MIDRRTFLGAAALGASGAYVAPLAGVAAADQEVTGRDTPENPRRSKTMTRSITIARRYLNFPVKTGAPKRLLRIVLDDKLEHHFYIELAQAEPDWWAFMDLASFQGKQVTLQADTWPEGAMGLKAIRQSDRIQGEENLYQESHRPQFHFSSRRGWLNDPNGLVFYRGEYHLFYQHNPYGCSWGNMHWGHAVSSDLVQWRELPIALYPDAHGTMFSGSAVIDENNTAAFQVGAEKTMVAIFTAAPEFGTAGPNSVFTQGIAFSNDRGRTWAKYNDNPVLPHLSGRNRDPNVIWFEPEKKWVMALYLDKRVGIPFSVPESDGYALFSSRDLKKWDKLCDVTLRGDGECPSFFEIAVDGNSKNPRWIFCGAAGKYMIGSFDGNRFVPESGPHTLHQGNGWYAGQTFNNVPAADGRRILMSWAREPAPFAVPEAKIANEEPVYRGMPFNQMMGIPVELTLRTTDDGLQLFANPIKELAALRTRSHRIRAQALIPGENPLSSISGELFDLTTEIKPRDATGIFFNLRGVQAHYDVEKQELSCGGNRASLKTRNGKIQLRLLVDRTSVEIFGNDGHLYMPMTMLVPADNRALAIQSQGGSAEITSLTVSELRSAWT